MNRYKVDLNSYSAEAYPYALFVKRGYFSKWEHMASYKDVNEALAFHRKLLRLPIYLDDHPTGE
jgi:hypothetical protein